MFKFDKEQYYKEAKQVYSKYPSNVSNMEMMLEEQARKFPHATSFQKKTWIYRVVATNADVIIFPSSPFYAEIDTGREQNSVTASFPPQPGIGCWLMKQYPDFVKMYGEWSSYYGKKGVMNGPQFMDAAHHYANCESVLHLGLYGIIKQVEERLAETDLNMHEQDFMNCMNDILHSLICISSRFSDKARNMLKQKENLKHQFVLKKIADTAQRVPAYPAQSFYEALCTIWFTREMCNALDGLGFAVIGHLDRILYPYYVQDIKKGILSEVEAQELLDCFLSITDARWDLEVELPGGTNADVVIGGCDEKGKVVYNAVTKMIIKSYKKYKFANPKLQARISKKHPDEYLNELGELAKMGLNVLSVFNDDVIIEANHRHNKKIEDCRLYVAGGCQEICISREVNCRAYTYLNLVQMLNTSLFPEYWNKVFARDGISFRSTENIKSFEDFYAIVMENYQMELTMFMEKYNEFGNWWKTINPSLFFSATMPSCIEHAKDVSEGGAVYNTDNFAAAGIGTVIDSLYAIKIVVFEEKKLSLEEFKIVLQNNFEDYEFLRLYILNKVAKFGRDSEATLFGKRVMHDLSKRLGGKMNYRGGYYEASLFAFYSYDWFKDSTIATADGRKKGIGLSRGVNPSESTEDINVATLLNSVKELDFSDFPGGAVTYMDIPIVNAVIQPKIFAAVIRAFGNNGGSVMDFNIVNTKELIEVQKNPDSHKNIVVRVCGYSAYFHTLSFDMQEEVIKRTQR